MKKKKEVEDVFPDGCGTQNHYYVQAGTSSSDTAAPIIVFCRNCGDVKYFGTRAPAISAAA